VVRDANREIASRNAVSDDEGAAWRVGPAIGVGTDESHAVELPNGDILQNMRNGPFRSVALSHDGGLTFGPAHLDNALVDPGCNAGITRVRYRRKDLLIFTNAASTRRENLTVKVSADLGRTWRIADVLHPGPAAYSTVAAIGDGSVGVLYECGEQSAIERIEFIRLPLDTLLSPR
jgi:sialidase-1